jgi:uncharacterized membrane protein
MKSAKQSKPQSHGRRLGLIVLSFFLASCALSLYFYPVLPDSMVSHWNALGQADGFMPKAWNLALIPLLIGAIGTLFVLVPMIDPLKENIHSFAKHYHIFSAILFAFMIGLQAQIILWSMGVLISPNVTIVIGLGILFFYVGVLCENTKRNWFIGIRTPWTLSSDIVWDKTHKLGGKLFKIAGIVTILGILSGQYSIIFAIIPVVWAAVHSSVYSYFEYKRENRKE